VLLYKLDSKALIAIGMNSSAMLTFVGLGLFDEKDISVKGLEAIKNADEVYAEFYTSKLVGSTIDKMEELYGKPVNLLTREDVEINPKWIERGKNKNIVFLTGGDTMVSTTHIDLRLRAIDMNIPTKLIHASSIVSAVCGLSGLQNYRFGKSTTIPYPYLSSRGNKIVSHTPHETICSNLKMGLHTLVFLDIDMEKGYMTINEALKILLEIDLIKDRNQISDSLVLGIARAGSDNPTIKCDYLKSLLDADFGEPLHILVVPANLHFIETESLIKLANAPQSLMDLVND